MSLCLGSSADVVIKDWGCHASRDSAGEARNLAMEVLEPGTAAPSAEFLDHGVGQPIELELHSARGAQ